MKRSRLILVILFIGFSWSYQNAEQETTNETAAPDRKIQDDKSYPVESENDCDEGDWAEDAWEESDASESPDQIPELQMQNTINIINSYSKVCTVHIGCNEQDLSPIYIV